MPIKIQGLLRKQCVAALAICYVNSMQKKESEPTIDSLSMLPKRMDL